MQALTKLFTNLMRKYLPGPFVFAIALTVLTIVLGVIFRRKNAV